MRRIAGISLTVFALVTASGCGSSDEKFSRAESERALVALDALEEYVSEGRCTSAMSRVNALAKQSTRVNEDRPELGDAYASSVARLQDLVARDCVEIAVTDATGSVTAATGATGEEPTSPTGDSGGGTDQTGGDNGGDNGGGTSPDNGGDNGGQNNNSTPPDNSGGAAL